MSYGYHVLAGVQSEAEQKSFLYDSRKGLEVVLFDLTDPATLVNLIYRWGFLQTYIAQNIYTNKHYGIKVYVHYTTYIHTYIHRMLYKSVSIAYVGCGRSKGILIESWQVLLSTYQVRMTSLYHIHTVHTHTCMHTYKKLAAYLYFAFVFVK